MTVRFALLVALTAAVALAQEPPVPTALLHSLIDIEALDTLDFEALDLAALAVEEVDRQEAGLPLRFAVARPVALTPAARGTWEDLADGRLLWRVRAADATSLNFGFGRFRMPPGGAAAGPRHRPVGARSPVHRRGQHRGRPALDAPHRRRRRGTRSDDPARPSG